MSISKLVVEAMLKEAAEAIDRNAMSVAAETRPIHQELVLTLADRPYTQITLRVVTD